MTANVLAMLAFFWLVWRSEQGKKGEVFLTGVVILAVLALLESQGLITHD